MKQRLTGRAANILLTGRTEWKKTVTAAECRVCVSVCLYFLWRWHHCLHKIMKISLTEQSQCSVSGAREKEHVATVLTVLVIFPLNQPGKPCGVQLIHLAKLHETTFHS